MIFQSTRLGSLGPEVLARRCVIVVSMDYRRLGSAATGCRRSAPPGRSRLYRSRTTASFPAIIYRRRPGAYKMKKLAMTAAELEAMIKAGMEDIGESSYGKTFVRRGLVGGRNISLR